MASSDILSQTLSSITAIKLEELSLQRSNFENKKAELLKAVGDEPNQREKVRILLDRIEDLSSMGKLKENPLISLKNIRQFLEQARHDPSVADGLQRDWQMKLEQELHINSLKYEYASLYGQLVNEWLSVSDSAVDSLSNDGSRFEEIGRKEMHEQRARWEEYVFKARTTDPDAIHNYLQGLFCVTTPVRYAYEELCRATKAFETELAVTVHFEEASLTWVIKALLRSDLLTDEKRKVLKDFLNNKVVLAEVADILNMRMRSLDKWQWDPEGTLVEQRRQVSGRYRFYHDEDLLQTILLRYIGVKWSVHFKAALSKLYHTQDVWKSSCTPVPASERQRREYFLGKLAHSSDNVESQRQDHFDSDIFLEQLQDDIDERRGGYDSHSEDVSDTRKSSLRITQSVLHTLATEIIMKTRLGEEICAVRSDFAWFGPSLPHSTIFAVLEFFNVSDQWIGFFRRALEAPMKFVEDGPDGSVRVRKRGTPISGPLSDMLGETVLFCLDFAFNLRTGGARLYRLHDDIWFWGPEETCVTGWGVMTEFAQLMGLDFNQEKTGSVRITQNNDKARTLPSSLPKGDVSWGFLKLDADTGRFLIDENKVDIHIEELRRQLAACKSVFDWIQAWNVYGVRYFTNNFGRPANCFGRAHVDMMLETFARIQFKLFASTGGSVTATLKKMLTDRFGVTDIPEGYLYLSMAMGGLDLKSPFVDLYLIRNNISSNPDERMDHFFQREEASYRLAKSCFDKGIVPRISPVPIDLKIEAGGEQFMSIEEYTRYREQTSADLHDAYTSLMLEPEPEEVMETSDVLGVLDGVDIPVVQAPYNRGSRHFPGITRHSSGWAKLTPYERWIIQLYASDMIRRFGGLNVVESGLLPTGMVHMFRESRFKWQG
jgi:DNA-binding transcriptional MerR regulator